MKKYKYLKASDNGTRCPIAFESGETGRWSLLPTYGITAYSDNTCTFDDLMAWCRRVGYTASEIDEFHKGNLAGLTLIPHDASEGLAPIALDRVADFPFGEEKWRPIPECWSKDSVWVFDGWEGEEGEEAA